MLDAILTDEELIGREIEVDDPLSLDGLIPRARPIESEMPTLERLYRRGSGGSKVPCGYCRKPDSPNHLLGFVMRYADGSRVLIGNLCGSEHFGQQQFKKMVQTAKSNNDRRHLLLRRRATIEALPTLRGDISVVSNSPQLLRYKEIRRGLSRSFPHVSAALNYAVAAQNGVLMHTVQVRDRDAESKREERREAEAKRENRPYEPLRTPIYRQVEEPLGTLRSGAFFLSEGGADRRLEQVLLNLIAFEDQLPSTSFNELVQAFRRLSDLLISLGECLDLVDGMRAALTTDNLRLIASWATERKLPGTYVAGVDHLEHTDAHGAKTRVTVPPSFSPIDRSFIVRFQDAIAAK